MGTLSRKKFSRWQQSYFGCRELDLFILETKAKMKVTELINPIVVQIESEREERARIEVQQDKVIQRLTALEGLLGVSASGQ